MVEKGWRVEEGEEKGRWETWRRKTDREICWGEKDDAGKWKKYFGRLLNVEKGTEKRGRK